MSGGGGLVADLVGIRKFQVRLGGGLVALEELGHGPCDPILAGLIAGWLGGFGIQLGPLRRQSRGDIEVGPEEFFAENGQHLRMDEVAVLEADLDLGRMDIDIEFLSRHFKEQKHHGELIGFDQAAVGLAEGVADEFVADEAAVEEGILEVAGAAAPAGVPIIAEMVIPRSAPPASSRSSATG